MSKTKVIIVGGGIAGIKAALELQTKGIDYLILEAKSRLGGRLRTVQGENYKYDLGASWFHETLNNALFDEEVSINDGSGKPKYYYDDALPKIINKDGVVPSSLKLQAISNEVHKFVEMETYKDLSKDESFFDTIVKYLKQRKHLLSDDQITNSFEFVRSLELWHGIDIKRLSSKYSSVDNAGRDAFALHYDRVLKRHTDQLDMSKVKLNSVIKQISRIENGTKVSITTTKDEEFIGDYTIVTIPQSMFQIEEDQEGYIKFDPPLPSKLTESLTHIHFGALGKVVLEFDKVFWETDYERALALATPTERFLESIRNGTDTPPLPIDAPVPKSWQYPVLVLNLAASFGKSTLTCLIQSPVTHYLEKNPSKAWDYLRPIIEKLAISPNDVPSPKNVIVSDWTIDPYQRGSYSACYPGDDPLIPIIQFEEGFGNVRFAGEHTILEGAGCVHGAWNSGKREAAYIVSKEN